MEALLAAAIEEDEAMMMMEAAAASSSSFSSAQSRLNDAPSPDLVDASLQHINGAVSTSINGHPSPVPPFGGLNTAATGGGGRITWQAMFRQLKDFHDLGNHRIPHRLSNWMAGELYLYFYNIIALSSF